MYDMEQAVQERFYTNPYTKETVHMVIVGKVDKDSKHRILKVVVKVVTLAQEEYHIQRIVKESQTS